MNIGVSTLHQHPLNAEERIRGDRLQPKETFLNSDVFDAPSGKWLPILHALVGTPVPENAKAIYIRPAELQ